MVQDTANQAALTDVKTPITMLCVVWCNVSRTCQYPLRCIHGLCTLCTHLSNWREQRRLQLFAALAQQPHEAIEAQAFYACCHTRSCDATVIHKLVHSVLEKEGRHQA